MIKNITLFAILILSVCALAFTPIFAVQAAQLWNKPSTEKTDTKKKSYYNKSKPSTNGFLYNSKSSKEYTIRDKNLTDMMKGYQTVRMTKQTKSALWSVMSPMAVSGRQSDINNALRHDYQTRINTSRNMINVLKQSAKFQLASEKRYENVVQAYKAKMAAKAENKRQKKERAMALMAKGKYKGLSSKKSGNVYVSGKASKSTGLKKPKKLFNDPYR